MFFIPKVKLQPQNGHMEKWLFLVLLYTKFSRLNGKSCALRTLTFFCEDKGHSHYANPYSLINSIALAAVSVVEGFHADFTHGLLLCIIVLIFNRIIVLF